MYLSTFWLALAVVLAFNHHPWTAFVAFEIWIVHRLLEYIHTTNKRLKR